MGGGIVLRKKSDKLGELFIFKKNKEQQPPAMKPEEVKPEEQEKGNE